MRVGGGKWCLAGGKMWADTNIKHCGAFHHEAPFRINVVRAVRYWLDEYYELRRTANHAMRCG